MTAATGRSRGRLPSSWPADLPSAASGPLVSRKVTPELPAGPYPRIDQQRRLDTRSILTTAMVSQPLRGRRRPAVRMSERFLLKDAGIRVLETAPSWVRTDLTNSPEAEAMPLDQFIAERNGWSAPRTSTRSWWKAPRLSAPTPARPRALQLVEAARTQPPVAASWSMAWLQEREDAVEFFTQQCHALASGDLIFTKSRGRQWKAGDQRNHQFYFGSASADTPVHHRSLAR
jgi:hypothetical protein